MAIRCTLTRLGSVVAGSVLVVLGASGSASAHVTVTPSATAAGEDAVLTFSVPHGCDGSATTKLVISMPEDVIEATPTRNPLYDVSTHRARLGTPIRAEDGDEITEKIDTITYTARTPLPDGYRDTFEVEVQVPDEVGERLSFPIIQQCEKGRTAWTETPASGQDPDSLEHPAPGFEITAATSRDEGGSETWGYAGVAVGLLGVVLGGAALARSRRGATPG